MPYRQDQINACFAQANRQSGAKKKKRVSGCKKMVKHKSGHKSESFESKLDTALFEDEEGGGEAKSKSQQRLFGMVRAAQKGKLGGNVKNRGQIEKMAKDIPVKSVRHKARTQHHGTGKHGKLPERKEPAESFEQRLNAVQEYLSESSL